MQANHLKKGENKKNDLELFNFIIEFINTSLIEQVCDKCP